MAADSREEADFQVQEKCTRQNVQTAALIAKFHSNHRKEDQFTAEIATQSTSHFN